MARCIAVLMIVLGITTVYAVGAQKKDLSPGMIAFVIEEDSPAAKAGVQKQDLLLYCDNEPMIYTSSLKIICSKAERNGKETVKLQIKRGEQNFTIDFPTAEGFSVMLRPALPDELEDGFSEYLDSDPKAEEVMKMAETAEKEGDLRAAAWLFELTCLLDIENSVQSGAATKLIELSSKIDDTLGEVQGHRIRGVRAVNAEDHKQALKEFETAIATQEKLIPETEDHRATLLGAIAAAFNLNDIETARKYSQRIVDILKKIHPDGADTADVIDILAIAASRQNDYKYARQCYIEELAIREKIQPDSLETSKVLIELARTELTLSELNESENHFKRALDILQKLSPDSAKVADVLNLLGRVAQAKEDFPAAMDYFQASLKIWEKISPDSSDVAIVLCNIGSLLKNIDKDEEAYKYIQKALAIQEKLESDPLLLASILSNLSSTIPIHDSKDLDEAEEYVRKALEIRERLVPDTTDVAISLNNLGNILTIRGKLNEAEECFRKALAIYERMGVSSLDMATTLNNLSDILVSKGEIKEAKAYALHAFKIREELAPNGLEVASSLTNLASILQDEGDLESAKEYMQRALSIKERLIPNTSEVASSLNNLAAVLMSMGDLAVAQSYLERALEMLRNYKPGDTLSSVLHNLGSIAVDTGNLPAALDYYQQVIEFREKVAPDGVDLAMALNNIALVHEQQHEYEQAKKYLLRALSIYEKQAPNSYEMTSTLGNLGQLAKAQGDIESAESFTRRAITILEKAYPDSLHMATLLNNLATILYDKKDTDGARSSLKKALKICELSKTRGTNVASMLINLGKLALNEDDMEEARSYSKKAVSIAESCGDPNILTQALHLLGVVELDAGNKETALENFKTAVDTYESISYTNTETRERLLLDGDHQYYEHLILLLIAMDRPEEAFGYIERAKSKAVVDGLNVWSIELDNKELIKLLKKYNDLQAQLEAQQQAISKENSKPENQRNLVKIEQLTKLLAQTKAEFYQVLTQIRQDYGPEYASLVQVEPTEFSSIQKELPEDAVVVEYFPAEDKLYIFLVTKNSFKVKEHSIPREDLDMWVEEVRETMDAWRQGFGSEEIPEALVYLHKHLIEPVMEDISEKKTVVFVPSGKLCYLPFSALARENGDGGLRYLAEEDYRIVTLTQMSLLGKLLSNEESTSGERSFGALAFGNPAGIEPALPSAEDEVNAIASIYPGSKSMTGEDVSEWRVKLQAQYGSILHFATHGMLIHSDPTKSYIALAAGENEDGRLTEGEIFGLPLTGTKLVVLSACQTAVAEENPGREISSLAQAFAIAGAPTVVASLWSVNDASTGKLMTEFYKQMAEGKPKAKALQMAQRSLIASENHNHPFFWAGFVLLGAWE